LPGVYTYIDPSPSERKRAEAKVAEATAQRLKQEAEQIEAKSKTVRWIKAVQKSCRARPIEF
jgi:hypothetical protein